MTTQFIDFFGTILGKIVAVVLIVLLIVGATSYCSSNNQEAEQHEQNARTSEAILDGVEVAQDTLSDNLTEDEEFKEVVAVATEEARKQTDEKVSRDIVVAAICKLPNYSGHASCAVREVDSSATD